MLADTSSITGLLKGLLPGVAVVLLFGTASTHASIVLPEMSEFKFEETASGSSTIAPRGAAPESPAEPKQNS